MPDHTPQDQTPREYPWEGDRVTNRLQLWEHEDMPGIWLVCGKENHLCGMGSPADMIRLARLILEHFPDDQHTSQTDTLQRE